MSCGPRRLRREIHVFRLSTSGRWVVSSAGRIRSRHRRQSTAIRAGKRVARRRRLEMVIHGRDGRFRSKDSYGSETRRHDRNR